MTPSAFVVVMTWPAVKDGVVPPVKEFVPDEILPPAVVVGTLPPELPPGLPSELLPTTGASGEVLVEVAVSGGRLGEPPTVLEGVSGELSIGLPRTGPMGFGVATAEALGDGPASVGEG